MTPTTPESLRVMSLCSGIGGLDLAVEQYFGGELVAYSENDKPAASIMERHWPGVPNIGDLKVADWAALGPIDIVCGGIPCQPWSTAGKLGRTDDDRHLWPYVARAVGVLRPRYVIVEEVAGFLAPGGLDAVLADLCALGFDAEWTTVRASDVGAPHRRERVFLVAWDAERPPSDAFTAAGGSRGTARESGRGAGDVDLFPTPMVSDASGGRHATNLEWDGGTAYRPSGTKASVSLRESLDLLPTPAAGNFNDGEDVDGWLARREAIKAKGINGNGMGTPLAIAVKTLPTPTARLGTPRGAQADRYRNPERSNDLDDAAAWAEREGRWGDYAAAIERWEAIMGREAPAPLDGKRLTAEFVEWMMGYPEDWTAGLSRTARLKCLGNAVVTRQALHALELLTARAREQAA